MIQANQPFKIILGVISAIGSSLLLSLPAIAQLQPNNPNYGGEVIENGTSPTNSEIVPSNRTTTPLETTPAPEQLQLPSATIRPMNGVVNIVLSNQTGDPITYQVIGDTNQRILPGRSSYTLQSLKTPVNITFQRPDGGLLRVIPQASSKPGTLDVALVETTNLGVDKNAMTVQESGNVFLN